jgi:hypothetical protein
MFSTLQPSSLHPLVANIPTGRIVVVFAVSSDRCKFAQQQTAVPEKVNFVFVLKLGK